MQGLAQVALSALALVACSRSSPAPPPPDAAPAVAIDPLTKVARDAIAEARTALGGEGCLPRAQYLTLRRALAATVPLVRYVSKQPAELIVGPRVVIGETAGVLSELDLAITASDCVEQRANTSQIDRALLLIDSELARRAPVRRAVVRGLSEAAYDLGAELLESTAGTPEAPDAVLADVQGALLAIERGSRALGATIALGAFERLRTAKSALDIDDRASLVVATGPLGDAIRAVDPAVAPPYPTLRRTSAHALALPEPRVAKGKERVAIGELLFRDKRLSRGRVRACTSCHDPERAFADARVTPLSLDPKQPLRRNTPSLLYAPLAAVLHWDGRIRTADAQALNVIHARAEMGLDNNELVATLRDDAALNKMFAAAFTDGLTAANVGHALAAWESAALVPGAAPIDELVAGNTSRFTSDMSRGLDVFVGRGRCARCHVPPTFGGARPPDFTAPVFGVLGVPDRPNGKALDDDPGRFALTKDPLDRGAFRTPTVRNVAASAPYFHHGRFATLEEVVDFYDKGGGRALGLAVPNQDPDVRPLALTPEERRVLLVFLREGLREARP